MKILVCISKAPDTTSKIAFTDGGSKFDENGVQYIVNPYDEWYALVRALELKETLGGNVTILSVGGTDYEPIIRKALAIGADDAARIDAAESDSLYVAKQIASYAQGKEFDIIFFGKETINYNGSIVPGMVAELLELPFVSLAMKLNMNGEVATIEREVNGGEEVLEVNTPFVVSAAKGMAEQRIPNMRGIMTARTKTLTVLEAVAASVNTKAIKFEKPTPKSAVKLVAADNLDELIHLLHNEAKVI